MDSARVGGGENKGEKKSWFVLKIVLREVIMRFNPTVRQFSLRNIARGQKCVAEEN